MRVKWMRLGAEFELADEEQVWLSVIWLLLLKRLSAQARPRANAKCSVV
jgi:hypothetical protein